MSDVLQGALIGIGGIILGAAISAFSTLFISKSQLRQRLFELRSERLVKAREQVLIPLRQVLACQLQSSIYSLMMTVRMMAAHNRGDKRERVVEETKLWEAASDESIEAANELERLKGQMSDPQLCQLIEMAQDTIEKENPRLIEIVTIVNNPTNSGNQELLKSALTDLKDVRNRMLGRMIPVNQRIEELLSGS